MNWFVVWLAQPQRFNPICDDELKAPHKEFIYTELSTLLLVKCLLDIYLLSHLKYISLPRSIYVRSFSAEISLSNRNCFCGYHFTFIWFDSLQISLCLFSRRICLGTHTHIHFFSLSFSLKHKFVK